VNEARESEGRDPLPDGDMTIAESEKKIESDKEKQEKPKQENDE